MKRLLKKIDAIWNIISVWTRLYHSNEHKNEMQKLIKHQKLFKSLLHKKIKILKQLYRTWRNIITPEREGRSFSLNLFFSFFSILFFVLTAMSILFWLLYYYYYNLLQLYPNYHYVHFHAYLLKLSLGVFVGKMLKRRRFRFFILHEVISTYAKTYCIIMIKIVSCSYIAQQSLSQDFYRIEDFYPSADIQSDHVPLVRSA